MNEIRDELQKTPRGLTKTIFSKRNTRIVLLFCMTVLFAIYVGDLLFGFSSYSTILSLEEQKENITQEIEVLKVQNAKYQKEYFELKRIGGEK